MLQSLLNVIRHHRPWKIALATSKKRQHNPADLSMCVPFFKDCYLFSSSKDIKKCKKKTIKTLLLQFGGRKEIGSQLRPTHTNFTLFVLLLAVAWHVAANARLHKYEYISLLLVVPADCRRPCYHTFTP